MGDQIIVLDAYNNSIVRFGETEYGSLINDAVGLRYDGDETEAISKWQQVLKLDENNELANTGIGKAYLTAGENRTAMKYLKLGRNRKYYSVAWKRYRNELLIAHINVIMTAVIVLIIAYLVYAKLLKKRRAQGHRAKEGGLT